MLTLKKSFEYQNYLNRMMNAVEGYLVHEGNTTTTVQKHMRSKANADAVDEDVVVLKNNPSDYTVNQMVDFLMALFNEKELLTKAIDEAKANTEINVDSSVALNKHRQTMMNIFNSMAKIKPSESTGSGYGYKFDVNGAQVRYVYDIKSVKTIDFNRDTVKSLVKKLNKDSDAVSEKLDLIHLQTKVDFEPQFELTDSIEDAMTKYFKSAVI